MNTEIIFGRRRPQSYTGPSERWAIGSTTRAAQYKAWTSLLSTPAKFRGFASTSARFSGAIAVEVLRREPHERPAMDEQEFRRTLDLFPVVRSRDYLVIHLLLRFLPSTFSYITVPGALYWVSRAKDA
jgi:hypothetical protein